MGYLGDISPGKILNVKFCTINASGAPATLTSGVIKAYRDDDLNSEVTTGITLSADFDSVTGLNNVKIDTSDAFYAAGSEFNLVITTGTVNSVSVVGYVIGSFSINHRSAVRPTTADRTLDISATGGAGIDWSNVEAPTTTLNLSGTTIKAVTDAPTGALTTAHFDSIIGVPATGTIAGDIAEVNDNVLAIIADTGSCLTLAQFIALK